MVTVSGNPNPTTKYSCEFVNLNCNCFRTSRSVLWASNMPKYVGPTWGAHVATQIPESVGRATPLPSLYPLGPLIFVLSFCSPSVSWLCRWLSPHFKPLETQSRCLILKTTFLRPSEFQTVRNNSVKHPIMITQLTLSTYISKYISKYW